MICHSVPATRFSRNTVKISQDVRGYAAKQNTCAMLEARMAEKSAEFRTVGREIYLPAAE